LCVAEAIEAAVTHLIADGIREGSWALKDEASMADPVLRRYLSARSVATAPAGTMQ